MSPKQIIRNGFIQRTVRNYYPRHYHQSNNHLLFFGNLRPVALSNDVILIKRRSILFQKIFEYQQLMINTVHSSYYLAIKTFRRHQPIVIPLAAFPHGVFINNDDARRFYQWLKFNLK